MCGALVMAESNINFKFLIVADGDISLVPMSRIVQERRDIRWDGEAIRNSVFESLGLRFFFFFQLRISVRSQKTLK